MPSATLTITITTVQIDVESALMLWARVERDGHRTGYYRHQPFYKPELVGYRESSPIPTDEETEAGNRVGGIVNKMAIRDLTRADALRYYYGAYPGAADDSKNRRVHLFHVKHGIDKRNFYRLKDDGKRMVEGALVYA